MSGRNATSALRKALPLVVTLVVPVAGCGEAGSTAVDASAAPAADGSAPEATPEVTDVAAAPATDAAPSPAFFKTWSRCGDLPTDRPSRNAYALSASSDGRWLAMLDVPPFSVPLNSPDRVQQSVVIWDLTSMTMARRLTDIDWGSPVLDVDVSPDGTLVAVTGDGSRMLRVSDGSRVWEHPPPPDVDPSRGIVRNFAFSPDGQLLASGTPDGIDLLRADDGQRVATIPLNRPSTPGVAFSPDGRYLASSDGNLWNAGDQTHVRLLPLSLRTGLDDGLSITDHWAQFSPDGTHVLLQRTLSAFKGTQLLWSPHTDVIEVPSGNHRWDAPFAWRRPTFSPDGSLVLAGLWLLDVATGAGRVLPLDHGVSLFLGDGRIVAQEVDDGVMQLWCAE